VKLKALALVVVVLCATLAVCYAGVLTLSRQSAPRNHNTGSYALVDDGGAPITTPNGPIDTPGGPT
jgi:hypothetical protein